MSKIARYAGNLPAFASNAQGLERTVFGGTAQADDLTSQVTDAFRRGWGIVGPSENPSLEDFNAAFYTLSQLISYQHQMGVPEWDAKQEYYVGSVCSYKGEPYVSLTNSNTGNEPPSAQWTPVITAKNGIENLGMIAGAPAIGIPFFWPSSAMPNTVMTEWANMVFLKFNGATFSATTYPKLAQVIPNLTLPDSRGEFPRIWDDGRGIDVNRSLLSSQTAYAGSFTWAATTYPVSGSTGNVVITDAITINGVNNDNAAVSTTTAIVNPGDNRPRNIAFNFLVRAK